MSDITVNDRRLFTKDGEVKEEGQAESLDSAAKVAEAKAAAKAKAEEEKRKASEALKSITPSFSSLVLALATSALINLGERSPDDDAPPQIDIPQAKHTIDLLGVLAQKTEGNLDETEDQLLKTLLSDLRLKYVTLLKK